METSNKKDLKDNLKNDQEKEESCDCDKKKEDEDFEKIKKGLADANDKYIRLYAEFDNYRRRTKQEHAMLLLTASEKVLTDLLPIIDDFSRAFETIDNQEAFKDGIKIINDKFLQILKTNDVIKIEAKCGDDFDESIHEAIVKQKTEDEKLKGKIVDIIENGYKMHDKILRYVKVIIGD